MLVVIGLIVGGVLVGQSLISAAEVRAQITQIDRYNSAVNTFRGKFNAIPGDMNVATAQQYGFLIQGCDGTQGRRDGNGLIDGYQSPNILLQGAGETGIFWEDLSNPIAGNLIDGTFPGNGASQMACYVGVLPLNATQVSGYYPSAKIGRSNYVYVYESSGINWFGISNMTGLAAPSGTFSGTPNISVIQVYNIDKKIDDGVPVTGNVQAVYLGSSNINVQNAPNTTTSGGTSSSCYDTTTGTYSVTQNNGNGGNCALSFKFQ